jgi:hypothetical protein
VRILLAFRCFFRLLVGARLPAEAARYLPEQLPRLPEPAVAPVVVPEAAPKKNAAEYHREGALAMLALLQREGRLVDFLSESIDAYADAEIGAAVRDIHRGCKKVLADHLTLEPVMPGAEESNVKVPPGFDPGEVRLVGTVQGAPPFHGVLRHHGWRVTKTNLPLLTEGVDRRVLAPAEVELQ